MNAAHEVILNWSARLLSDEKLAKHFDCIYKLILLGEGGGTWVLRLKDQVKIEEGEGDADCIIRMSTNDFVDLANGQGNPQVAYLLGKIEVEGDTVLASKLVKLFA